MKHNQKLILFLLLSSIYHITIAQKHDYVWVFGRNQLPNLGGYMNFNQAPTEKDTISIPITMSFSSGAMSDSMGELQFYTNGFRVANAQHQIMPHGAIADGDTLNMTALPQSTSLITLPHPSDPNFYYLIKLVYGFDNQGYNYAFRLKHCLIDMAADSGRGDVVLKNQTIVDDTLASHDLTAVRHGNGRDWWIVSSEYGSRNYWVVLLSDSGFTAKKQLVTGPASLKPNIQGSSAFSPDGSLYARYDQTNGGQMHLWRFDRCRGLLHDPLHFDFPKPTNTGALGVCFSPNNRFLYLCYGASLVQFDLTASDIAGSAVTLFTCATVNGNSGSFLQIGLAPDGKIYLRAYPSGVSSIDGYTLSVINQPDLKGLACDFQPSAIPLPCTSHGLVPNYPNYRLGARDCDTTGVSLLPPALPGNGLRISPNPASDVVHIHYAQANASVCLLNPSGQLVRSYALPADAGETSLSLSGLAAGVYILRVGTESVKLFVK